MNSLHAIIFFIVEVHSLHLLGLHETLRTHPFQNMFETGNIIQLKCCSSAITKELLVENFGGRLLLAEKSNPYFRINLIGADNKKDKQCGVVEFKNGSPQFNNMFELKTYGDRKYFLVLGNKCNKSDNAQSGRLFALGVDKCGNFVWRCLDPKLMFEEGTSCFQFYVKVKSGELIRNLDSKFEFQKWHLRRLVTEGYVHLPRICNNTNIDHCIAVLNNALGVPGRVVAGGVQSDGIGKLAGDLSNCEAVRSLFQGEVEAVVDALFAGAGAEKLNLSAQIAFRFPELRSRAEGGIGTDEFKSFDWHTDGLRQGHSHGFSILLGICLSDTVLSNSGNLTVWPGSHLLLHQCKFPPHGALDLSKLDRLVRENQHFSQFGTNNDNSAGGKGASECATASDCATASEGADGAAAAAAAPTSAGVTEVKQEALAHAHQNQQQDQEQHHDNEPADLPPLGQPLQLQMRTGDVVLLHPDLAHAGAPNYFSEVRRMLYYRLRVRADALLAIAGLPAETTEAGVVGGARLERGGKEGNCAKTGPTAAGSVAAVEGSATVGGIVSSVGWEGVVGLHAADMWVDLPVVQQQLGARELRHTMQLYQRDYQCLSGDISNSP